MICVFGKISPKPFVKKIIPYLLTPFSLSSSAACVPMTTDVCINKLGIDEKLTYFAIPLGATVNMNGSCCYLIMASYLFLKAAGIPMTFGIWLNIFVTVLLLAIGSPGVPGGAIINMTTIFSIVGVPSSAVALITSINQFVDMGCTSVNVFGDIACTTIVAAKDKLINKDIYNS
jgi:Na+/H+-dicarboxylate symporter